ncbi:uncharacterized protein EMH_0048550 [Eimeria mitis]|uniref:Transmembrane protein n=1 Tax=Eimeria mitis TaxID=44415 RepID=U6KDG1_9EIME|nr:uncharacterized protein EMH_0048550 [Eimeria mitis]CDJ35974.1 hypothetical protein EMH_0048550 [Eimeria mitis]
MYSSFPDISVDATLDTAPSDFLPESDVLTAYFEATGTQQEFSIRNKDKFRRAKAFTLVKATLAGVALFALTAAVVCLPFQCFRALTSDKAPDKLAISSQRHPEKGEAHWLVRSLSFVHLSQHRRTFGRIGRAFDDIRYGICSIFLGTQVRRAAQKDTKAL